MKIYIYDDVLKLKIDSNKDGGGPSRYFDVSKSSVRLKETITDKNELKYYFEYTEDGQVTKTELFSPQNLSKAFQLPLKNGNKRRVFRTNPVDPVTFTVGGRDWKFDHDAFFTYETNSLPTSSGLVDARFDLV